MKRLFRLDVQRISCHRKYFFVVRHVNARPKMNKLALLNIGFLSFCLTAAGQVDCVKHWSANKSQIIELDAILSEFEWQPVDTVYCDSFLDNEPFKYTWYIDFYNKQFGNYFSNARNISFAMFHFRFLRNCEIIPEDVFERCRDGTLNTEIRKV